MPENIDPAFQDVSSTEPAFLIWRVEKMKVCPLAKEEYGKFYRGDSYIVYHAAESAIGAGKTGRGPMDVHLHFWLGSETSTDEAGVAAFKTVELDDHLGGAPVQHREVEERESQRFRSYFRNGIRYLEGGIESGLAHVDGNFVPRMYMVKGKRSPIVRQLQTVDWSQMNDGDVYIIDTKTHIFLWTGKSANNMEKIQGARLAQSLKDEHGGGDIIIVESSQEQALHAEERVIFDKVLPFSERKVKPAEPDSADEKQDRRLAEDIKLYRCSDASGCVAVTEVKHGPLLQADLNSNDSFIVDNGEQGIWVWIGKHASKKERSEGMHNAQGFIQDKSYPSYTAVTRVIDGGEPAEFKSLFAEWSDKNSSTGLGRTHSVGAIAKTSQETFDPAQLHKDRGMAARTQMVDDGSAQKQVWRVENFDLAAVAERDHGRFYGGDCYVVMYTYRAGGRENIIIYFWLGASSSVDEQGTAALKARDLDDEHGGTPVQVRVVQGKEPPHFIAMFGGKLIIYSGGKASAFDGDDARDVTIGDIYVLHVRGTTQLNTRAIQVEHRARSLNSNDCFVFKHSNQVYVWFGKGSTDEERSISKELAQGICNNVISVEEGTEIDQFWEDLGGQEEYSNDKRLVEEKLQPARLFQCSNASGSFQVEEIFEFDQSDLVEDDVMLLDAWNTVFIWIGLRSNREERNHSERTAIEYLRTDPAGRGTETPILKVKQFSEPPNFTGFFGAWNCTYWSDQSSWATIRDEMAASKRNEVERVNTDVVDGVYSLEELQVTDSECLPDSVDLCRKERYLSREDFLNTFEMSPEEFDKIPHWKQILKKKQVGLF